jgi:L-seryl-tRNA(Ser) seleniumtransferase
MPPARHIPSIDFLLQRPAVQALLDRYGRDATLAALRDAAGEIRTAVPSASITREEAIDRIERGLAARLAGAFAPSLVAVVNATGVVVHTNLGRAPLAPTAAARVAEIAAGYSNLEYDLGTGRRGARDTHAEALLLRLTGAEAAAVVNNNAAALVLMLTALADGREVVVSRGELVEIGGGFRIPDIMAQSGAILREVGTTNRTRAADYAAAVCDRTAFLLRVHPSNFRIEGFTARPRLDELVAVGRQLGVPVVEDQGSGNLLDTQADSAGATALAERLRDWEEPSVRQSLAAGADLVCFSGDKLLGGPQAGIIAGNRALVRTIRTHPLMRALRVDKMTYAALEATLLEYAHGRALQTVPVARALTVEIHVLAARAAHIIERLAGRPGLDVQVVAGSSATGGGSAPGSSIPTCLLGVAVSGVTPDALEGRLRRHAPPVIARIQEDRVVLDLRTVLPEQDSVIVAALSGLA